MNMTKVDVGMLELGLRAEHEVLRLREALAAAERRVVEEQRKAAMAREELTLARRAASRAKAELDVVHAEVERLVKENERRALELRLRPIVRRAEQRGTSERPAA